MRSSAAGMLSSDSKTTEHDWIDGRYRIEAELGRGATAQVFRVHDDRELRQLALKRLSNGDKGQAHRQAMFEREYHTLAELAHPNIVRVFDYGISSQGPYYTMELLDGTDARQAIRAGELSVHQICSLLRDAASALALIHSRQLVHRDVSPRNLWCTADGRGKLIDFGTLVAMGPQSRVAGTPPFVPPEAVYVQPLDARCDIYALGALAYYMLTKRYPYPAREIAELRRLWQRQPTALEALAPDLPRALCELVMAQLSLDPRGRPGSAAEVVERLTAIAALSPQDERHAAAAFLTSPKLVGREVASGLLRKRLLRAIRGRGSSVAIVGPAGIGRSRMLASLVLETKLLGAAAISVGASATSSASLSLAGVLAQRLLETVPGALLDALANAPVLGHLSPELHEALGKPALAELAPASRASKLSAAIVRLFDVTSHSKRLVLAVDDVHKADAASLAVLGRLSLLARERRLLIVTSFEANDGATPSPALELLVAAGNRVELNALDAEQTHELLASLFGAAPGLEEAASWLHELAQGSPQSCMQYAQYLVDRGVARYEAGRWTLPKDLRKQGLPPTLEAMFENRVRALGDDARALALGLALARDESRSIWQPETHVSIEDYPKLLGDGDWRRAFRALDELLRAGIVQQRDEHYVFGQRTLVDALLRVAPPEEQRRMHARLADVFSREGYDNRMLVVSQLQRAGEHRRARALLAPLGAPEGAMNWGTMRVSVTARCARSALAHWQSEGGTPLEGLLLRALLLLTGAVYDWRSARLGDEQLARLRADIGLDHFEQTDPALPARERLQACMQLAEQRYARTPENERGRDPESAVRDLLFVSVPLQGAYVNCHDVASARRLCACLEPLRSSSDLAALVADVAALAIERVTGRELSDRVLLASARIMQTSELPEVLRTGAAVVQLHTQAMIDARRGRIRALALMDQLAQATGDDFFSVLHGRWIGHAFRGQTNDAERFRKQSELITEDDVWRRHAWLFVEAELHALTGDLLALHRVQETLSTLARDLPGWRPWLLFGSSQIHRLRGELGAARNDLEVALVLAEAGEHRAYPVLAPARAEILRLLGDAQGALLAVDALLSAVAARSLDLGASVMGERTRALAYADLGRYDAAKESLDRAFALASELGYDGLPFALLYEARARIALASRDGPTCRSALTRLRELLKQAHAPALVSAYEALREESQRQLAISAPPAAGVERSSTVTEFSAMLTEIRTRLGAFSERRERALHALSLLLEDCGAASGHLLVFEAGQLAHAASIGFDPPSEALLLAVERYLEAEVDATSTAVITEADLSVADATDAVMVACDGISFAPVLLTDFTDGRSVLAGVVLLALAGSPARMPRSELTWVIGRCLLSSGDSIPALLDS